MTVDAALIAVTRRADRVCLERERELAQLARLMREPGGLGSGAGAVAPGWPRHDHREDDRVVKDARQIESPDSLELLRTRCPGCGYQVAVAVWCRDPACCSQSPWGSWSRNSSRRRPPAASPCSPSATRTRCRPTHLTSRSGCGAQATSSPCSKVGLRPPRISRLATTGRVAAEKLGPDLVWRGCDIDTQFAETTSP